MSIVIRLAVLLLALPSVQAAWHQVFVPLQDKQDLVRLRSALSGLDPCGTVFTEAGVELPVDDADLAALSRAGLAPQLLVTDLEEFYASRFAADRNYGAYHTYSEGMAEIQQLHADFPEIVGAPFSIGTTVGGNTIWAFKLSDNPGVDEAEPEVLFGAYIHAREAITIEVLLHFLHHLTDNYGTDSRVTDIVDGRELWFIPFLNPDGVLYNETTNPAGGGMWRKNRRNNGDGSYGVDLNRNFGYQWGYDNVGSSPTPSSDTYRGPSANSELETQAVRSFVNAHSFAAMQSYHSYSNLMIYPYGYMDIHCEEPWHTGYVAMTDLLSADNGYACGTAWELLYNTNGDAVDWGHGATGEHARIMSITTEVGTSGDGFWPAESRIPALVAENLEPNLLFAEIAGNPWSLGAPAAPAISGPAETNPDFALTWTTAAPDPDIPAVSYELRELSGLIQGSDAFANAANWTGGTAAFALSSARSYSAPSSFFGGTGHNRNAISLLNQPISVTAGMQISLRMWYNIEPDYDYAYVEVSPNGTSWTGLAGTGTTTNNPNGRNDGNGITGASSDFVLATFPLTAWVGQSIQVRLRYETDGYVLNEGIYVDDFSPVVSFTSETTLASAHPATDFSFTDHSTGIWFYRVRARDAQNDLSGWSNLLQVVVTGGTDQSGPLISHSSLPDTGDALGPWPVDAQISDASGVASASLEYRVNGGGWSLLPMNLTVAPNWHTAIPGPLSTPSLVEYRITAVDASPLANPSVSPIWDFQILAPVGLQYCQDFSAGLDDFSVILHEPAGSTWGLTTYDGQGQTAYIQYTGPGQVDHASLLSPVFDCSQQASLQLDFWHHLKMGYSGAWTLAQMRGSLDGGLTWPYLLGEWASDGSAGEEIIDGLNTLDISSWAAGQTQVRIAFEYSDLNDWYWYVDDVCLTGTLFNLAPVTLQITTAGGDAQLTWAPTGADAYHVYGSDQPFSGYIFLASVPGAAWTDAGALSDGRRCYQVKSWQGALRVADPVGIPKLDARAGRRAAPPFVKQPRVDE